MNTQIKTTYPTIVKTKRAAIYTRVSTEDQASEDRTSLALQEEKLRQFCASQDFSLEDSHVYIEKGVSGSLDVDDRPEMHRMFEAARNKEIDIIIVYKLDRFFRNQRKALNALHELVELEVDFKSVVESEIDTSNATGRLMLQIMNAFTEHERETIRDRMMDGKLKAAANGKWVTGVPPYGYRVDKKTKTLTLHKEEAEVIKQFYEWLVYEKCSLREITRRAIEQNLPTPAHKSVNGKKIKDEVRNGKWYKRTIGRFLVNEVYTGKFYYNKYKRPFKYLDAIDNEEHQRPKSEHIELQVPEIVSREMFEKAIEQLKENRSMQKRNEKRTYLFSGLLHSGYTGRKLQSGYQKPKKDLKTPELGKYYHVYIPLLDRNNSESQQNDIHGQCAETRLLPIWDTLVSILKDPENTIPQLEEYTFKNSNEARTVKKIADLNKQIGTVKEQRQRIARAYTDMGIEQDEYESEMKEKRARQKELEVQRQKLSQTLLKKKEQKNRNEVIAKLFEKFQTKLDTVAYEQRQYILRLFVERITLFHKQNYAEVVFKFPTKTSVPTVVPAEISGDGQMRLVLHVKIKSEHQRRQEILKNNPAMYRPKRGRIA
jgi:site-specific DNA recombinase